jgi:hypothetical protein
MRKRRDSGRRFGAAAAMGVVLLCIALWGFTGCKDDPELSGENKITAFKIGDIVASILEVDQKISITVPAETNLKTLTPVVSVSAKASVSPGSEEAVDISNPVSYTVTAENGVTRTYTVTVLKEPVKELKSLSVQVLKEEYPYDTVFDSTGIVVTGTYSDGTTETLTIKSEEDPNGYEVTGYNKEIAGKQNVLVTLNGRTAVFSVSVKPQAVLESLAVEQLKTTYPYGEDFDSTSIIVTGTYSNGTTRTLTIKSEEEPNGYEVTGYNKEKSGSQTLVVSLDGKTSATFSVTVDKEKAAPSVTIDWPNAADKQPVIYGLPEKDNAGDPDFTLSVGGNGNPKEIVISAGADNSNNGTTVYDQTVSWFVDGVAETSSTNILTIKARDYTLQIPHRITLTGTKNGVEYSTTITFTVVK